MLVLKRAISETVTIDMSYLATLVVTDPEKLVETLCNPIVVMCVNHNIKGVSLGFEADPMIRIDRTELVHQRKAKQCQR